MDRLKRRTLVPGGWLDGGGYRLRSQGRAAPACGKVIILTLLFGLLLAACAGSEVPAPLGSIVWELTAIGNKRPIEGRPITMILENGSARGSAGCNTYGGEFKVHGDRIVFENIFATMMACPEPEGIMEQEQAYLAFLGAVDSFQVSENRLRLFRPDGEAIVFIAAEPAE